MAFKAVNWSPNELIGAQKTNEMADNADWLYNRTPRAYYTLPGGLKREQGVKIASGRVRIGKKEKSDSASATVRFGNFFSVNCQPIVTTGVISGHQPRTFCVVRGIGQLQPDHRGFNVDVNIAADKPKNDHIAQAFFVSWMAMGY